jgi:hypothetical protein
MQSGSFGHFLTLSESLSFFDPSQIVTHIVDLIDASSKESISILSQFFQKCRFLTTTREEWSKNFERYFCGIKMALYKMANLNQSSH